MIASVLRRSAYAITVASLLVGVLAGCGASAQSPIEDYSGPPRNAAGEVEFGEDGTAGAWLEEGASFAVTVSGSSTCPPVASGFSVTGNNAVTVTLEEIPPDKACTADFVPHTTVFSTPDEFDPGQELGVTVGTSTFAIPALV